jgi:hypothetical protein
MTEEVFALTVEARLARMLRDHISQLLLNEDMDMDTTFSIFNIITALEDADKIAITIVPKYKDSDYD